MSILDKLLSSRGIQSITELSPEELGVYEKYEAAMKKKDVSIKELEAFIRGQIKLIESKYAGPPSPHDAYLKACLHIYTSLLNLIEGPKIERENCERYLKAIIGEQ